MQSFFCAVFFFWNASNFRCDLQSVTDVHLEQVSMGFHGRFPEFFSQILNISLHYSRHHSPMLPGLPTEISGP